MYRLEDKTVFITGGVSGIGRAMAFAFAQAGANVVAGDIDQEKGALLAQEGKDKGLKIEYLFLDVTDEVSVKKAVEDTRALFGPANVLVNNAGGSSLNDRSITEIDLDDFWKTIKIDLLGTVLCCRHFIPELMKTGGGSIINMGSIAALRGLKGRDAYTAAKGGVTALSRAIAVEHAENNIRCNVIAPGAVLTDRMKKFIAVDPRVTAAVDKHLLGLPEPDEIAHMALYLASDVSRHVTGSVFQIDSGRGAAG